MSTFSPALKTILLGLAAVIGGCVFLAMGYSMWMMKDYMSHMEEYMSSMRDYMSSMDDSIVAMSGNIESMVAMSGDMREMRIAMVNMGGTPAQVAAIRPMLAGSGSGAGNANDHMKASSQEMHAVYDILNAFR
jgi:hypothetical protein